MSSLDSGRQPWAGNTCAISSGKVVSNIAGGGVRLGEQLIVTGFPAIRIGEGTSIMSRSYLYAHDSSNLIIGSRCSFNHNVLLGAAGGEIVIGNDVLIGPNVVFTCG
jgi:acetyltransferase-like isoleucine patch superfamily enzyme